MTTVEFRADEELGRTREAGLVEETSVTIVEFREVERLGRTREEATDTLEVTWAAVELVEETSVMRVEPG